MRCWDRAFCWLYLQPEVAQDLVRFIVTVTNPFYQPFRGIVASPSTEGGHTLMMPLVIAIIVYVLLHLAINGLLRIIAHRKTAI